MKRNKKKTTTTNRLGKPLRGAKKSDQNWRRKEKRNRKLKQIGMPNIRLGFYCFSPSAHCSEISAKIFLQASQTLSTLEIVDLAVGERSEGNKWRLKARIAKSFRPTAQIERLTAVGDFAKCLCFWEIYDLSVVDSSSLLFFSFLTHTVLTLPKLFLPETRFRLTRISNSGSFIRQLELTARMEQLNHIYRGLLRWNSFSRRSDKTSIAGFISSRDKISW